MNTLLGHVDIAWKKDTLGYVTHKELDPWREIQSSNPFEFEWILYSVGFSIHNPNIVFSSLGILGFINLWGSRFSLS